MYDRGELPEASAYGVEHVPGALRGRAEEHEGEEHHHHGRSETTLTLSLHTTVEVNTVILAYLL